MHQIVLLMLVASTMSDYLVSLKLAPGPFKFVPEILSAVVAVYVVVAGIRTRFQYIRTQYWIFFIAIMLIILCGILSNMVAPGPIIAGLRMYARAIPFFFLPAVYPFKDWQIRQQLILLSAIALLQLPLAIYQRYTLLHEGRFTGDYVFGTLMLSPTLTIFLLGGICILFALTMKSRLSKAVFGTLFVLFVIPTTINETKITIFLLPMCVLMTMMIVTQRGARLKMFGTAMLLLFAAGAIFVPIFNWLGTQNVSTSEANNITDMFTKKDYIEKYMNRETRVGDTKEVGRVDAFTVPLGFVLEDPVTAAFGVGLGNASISSLGTQFSGAYSATLGRYATGATSAGALLLEIGTLGFICVYGLHWLILSDSMNLARNSNDLVGSVAAAWPAVVTMYSLVFFYAAPVADVALSYLFWYISGLIVAARTSLVIRSRHSGSQKVRGLRYSTAISSSN